MVYAVSILGPNSSNTIEANYMPSLRVSPHEFSLEADMKYFLS
jgi:hypothetical protein